MGRGALLVLLSLAVPSQPASAQDPDTIPAEPTDTVLADTSAADTTAPDVAERSPYEPPRWAVSLTAGFIGFGELQTQAVLARRTDDQGEVTTTVLQRGLEADGGLQVAVSALLGLTPAWAVRAGAGWGRGRLTAEVSGGDDELAGAVAELPVPGQGEFRVLSGELAVRFRTVSGRRLQPYLEVGMAALRWDMDGEPIVGGEGLAGRTRWAGLAAAGGIIPVWPGISGRVQLSGAFFRSPLAPAAPGPLGAAEGLVVIFPEPATGAFADPAIELTRTLRLDVGVSMELGRAGEAPPGSAADAPPSAGRR